jgi:hypothetical protein
MKNKSKKGLFAIVIIVSMLFGQQAISQNQIVGQITYGGNSEFPLSNVNVELYDLQNTLIESTVTNTDGYYDFDDVLSGEYYVKSSSNDDDDEGVIDINDAYYIMLYMLGNYELSDMQYEAADVNNSGIVNWSDYIQIVVNYLLYDEPFPAGEWQFEDQYVNLLAREEVDTLPTWGCRSGDLFIDWQTSGRSDNTIFSNYKPIQLQKEEIQVVIESSYNENIGGYDLELDYPADLINILSIEGLDANLNYTIDELNGRLHLIWLNENPGNNSFNGSELVTLTIEPKTQNINAEGLITLSPASSLLSDQGVKIEDVEISLPQFKQSQVFAFEVNTYPNPVVDQLNINLTMPEANRAEMMIFDLQGRLIEKQENILLTEGEQLISISTQQYMPGHYLYVFNTLGSTQETIQGRFYRSH